MANRCNDWQELLKLANKDLEKYGTALHVTKDDVDGTFSLTIHFSKVNAKGKEIWFVNDHFAENYYEDEMSALINDAWVHARAKAKEMKLSKNRQKTITTMYERYYGEIKNLHQKIVNDIVSLMKKHDVDTVDLLGSDARHAMVTGYPSDGMGAMTLEVNQVVIENDTLMLDVILDVDTDELAEQSPDGDIGDAYQTYAATDYNHIIPCAGIDQVYDAVYEVLEYGK